jgi:hypothetical protein
LEARNANATYGLTRINEQKVKVEELQKIQGYNKSYNEDKTTISVDKSQKERMESFRKNNPQFANQPLRAVLQYALDLASIPLNSDSRTPSTLRSPSAARNSDIHIAIDNSDDDVANFPPEFESVAEDMMDIETTSSTDSRDLVYAVIERLGSVVCSIPASKIPYAIALFDAYSLLMSNSKLTVEQAMATAKGALSFNPRRLLLVYLKINISNYQRSNIGAS